MCKLPYTVIGTYHPAKGATPEQIGHELEAIVASAGLKPVKTNGWPGANWWNNNGAEVRHNASGGHDVEKWHHDFGDKPVQVIVWANKNPTQLRFKYGRKVYQPAPFEVVAFDNALLHRRRGDEAGRLFFRQYVEP